LHSEDPRHANRWAQLNINAPSHESHQFGDASTSGIDSAPNRQIKKIPNTLSG
jgi:hypothetical protein